MDNDWRSVQEQVRALSARDQWLARAAERQDSSRSRQHMTAFLSARESKREHLTFLLGADRREELLLTIKLNRPHEQGWWSVWVLTLVNISLAALKALRELLFTKDGKRKSLTKANGFPTSKEAICETTSFNSAKK